MTALERPYDPQLRSATRELSDQRLRRHEQVRLLDRPRERIPLEAAVQPHADPATVADVGRDEVVLRRARDEAGLRAVRGGQPQRDPPVPMMVVRRHGEQPLAHEPRRLAVAEALRGLWEREAVLPDVLDSDHPWMSHPSAARAASITPSASVGCPWTMRATSE